MIELPLVNGFEVLPLRLIPFVTEPPLPAKTLLEHLYNRRGDHFPGLHARDVKEPLTVIAAVNWRCMYELENADFPAGLYVRKKSFEAYCRRTKLAVSYEAVTLILTNQIPEDKLEATLEGFEPQSKPLSRHTLTAEDRKPKGKSAIRSAIEAYLGSAPDGAKAGFYTFLKAKRKLTTNAILKDGEGYDIFFKSVIESGSKEGVYLNHPKEGKKVGEAGWNHYSGSGITELISREKGKRKK